MKTQKGITLIALMITIIVMLILVGVSVSVAINTGLFKTAQGVAKNTEGASADEHLISEGQVTINGSGTMHIQDYVDGLKSPMSYPTYEVGDEVTIGTENFYVIEDKGETLVLLAQYCLGSDGKQTSGEYENTLFSNNNYWTSNVEDISTVQGGEDEIAMAKVRAYGTMIETEVEGNVNARLLTKTEALRFWDDDGNDENNHPFRNKLVSSNYWLGTVEYSYIEDEPEPGVIVPIESWDIWCVSLDYVVDFKCDNQFGVRPVLEISKSLI